MPQVPPGAGTVAGPGAPGSSGVARLCAPELERTKLGAKWEVVAPADLPGLPPYVGAVVGRCGTVLVTQVADGGPLTVAGGQLFCGARALERAVAELGDLACQLAGRLDGRAPAPMVYAAVLVPEARSSLFHRDVLVSPPSEFSRGIEAFPAVQLPAAVARATAALKQATAVPVEAPPDAEAPTDGEGEEAGGVGGARVTASGLLVPSSPSSPSERPGPGGDRGAGRGPTSRHAPRPSWRRQGRRPSSRVSGVLVVGALFGAVGALTWYSARTRSGPATSSPAAAATTVDAATTTSVARFAPLLSYPGQQAGDVVAGTTGTLDLDGARVSLAAPVVSPSLVGHPLLCVRVVVHDAEGVHLGDQAVNWAVRSPSGLVEHPAHMADDVLLGRGQLVPGDSVHGRLCFAEPGQGGLYVLTYSPRPGRPPEPAGAAPVPRSGAAAARGVWLLRLLGR